MSQTGSKRRKTSQHNTLAAPAALIMDKSEKRRRHETKALQSHTNTCSQRFRSANNRTRKESREKRE
jgi:hypothetical protein